MTTLKLTGRHQMSAKGGQGVKKHHAFITHPAASGHRMSDAQNFPKYFSALCVSVFIPNYPII
jgi:hypothetical protein